MTRTHVNLTKSCDFDRPSRESSRRPRIPCSRRAQPELCYARTVMRIHTGKPAGNLCNRWHRRCGCSTVSCSLPVGAFSRTTTTTTTTTVKTIAIRAKRNWIKSVSSRGLSRRAAYHGLSVGSDVIARGSIARCRLDGISMTR